MSKAIPDFIQAMSDPACYRHPCAAVQRVETHISWIFLTGAYAYKVKKPVQFGFIDFSTRELRAHFCEEELRCNQAFTPELYLGLATVNRAADGRYQVDGDGPAIETAVKMCQFPAGQQADVLLDAGGLTLGAMRQFGLDLADQHAALPRLEYPKREAAARVLAPVQDNFDTLRPLCAGGSHEALLEPMRAASVSRFEQARAAFTPRSRQGFIRECHGDLHLSNMVLLKGRMRAFDCIEFNPDLRWIDVQSDAAFLIMDCAIRGREDLGYAFLDGYLDRSADYGGAVLSGFYQAYRSVVRAKVAALQLQDCAAGGQRRALSDRLERHLEWADSRLRRAPGELLLMCGLSGSGKSWLAQRLAPELPAVRLRSDVLRKASHGLAPQAPSDSPVDGGIYTPEHTAAVYQALLDLAGALVTSGETVIIDASFLSAASRRRFQQAAASAGAGFAVLHCEAPRETLVDRIGSRQRAGADPSEAGLEVLRSQAARIQAPGQDECAIRVDTTGAVDIGEVVRRIDSVAHASAETR